MHKWLEVSVCTFPDGGSVFFTSFISNVKLNEINYYQTWTEVMEWFLSPFHQRGVKLHAPGQEQASGVEMQSLNYDSEQCKDLDLQQGDQSLFCFMGKAGFALGREGCLLGEEWLGEWKTNFVLDFFSAVHGMNAAACLGSALLLGLLVFFFIYSHNVLISSQALWGQEL